MCGIVVIYKSSLLEAQLRDMALLLSRKIRHRGPDHSGIFIEGIPDSTTYIALTHERLAIVDPQSGAQPLGDASRDFLVTVNGEIFNHKELEQELLASSPELRSELEELPSRSDCASLPLFFKYYGANFIKQLNGMFAFAAYDNRSGRLVVARDLFGINPLYWGWCRDGSTIIASEMKCLSEHCIGFEEFPPGYYYDSLLEIEGGTGLVRYQNPPWLALTAPVPSRPLQLARLRSIFTAAVARQLMSDVPFAVLVSGGLDSSIVAAVVAKELAARAAANGTHIERLHTFSTGLEGSPDTVAAREVANFLGSEHHEFKFTVQQGFDSLKEVIYHVETYDVTTIRSSTPQYLLSRFIRSMNFKFVMSGEGADELFGGYLYFHKAPSAAEFHRETQRKLESLHCYDLLRGGKAGPAAGLEVRVPFLDLEFVEEVMGIDPASKVCTAERIEKAILREAFEGYLPSNILWRQKEQFSDGVGYDWIASLKDRAEAKIPDSLFSKAARIFPHNTPLSKEAFYYRTIFEQLFPHQAAQYLVPGGPSIACSSQHIMHWDASFLKNADQSGLSITDVHAESRRRACLSDPRVD